MTAKPIDVADSDRPGMFARVTPTAIDPAIPAEESSRLAGAAVCVTVRTGLPALPPKLAVRWARPMSATGLPAASRPLVIVTSALIDWPRMPMVMPVPVIADWAPPATSIDTGVPPTTSESVTGLGPVLNVTDSVPLSVTPGTFSAAVPLSIPATVVGVPGSITRKPDTAVSERIGVAPPIVIEPAETAISTTVVDGLWAVEVTCWMATLPVIVCPKAEIVTPVPLSSR